MAIYRCQYARHGLNHARKGLKKCPRCGSELSRKLCSMIDDNPRSVVAGRPTRAQVIAGRKLWRPRMPELPAQCASCPFREGNDAEFAAVVVRLDGSPDDARFARFKVKQECSFRGDFACHGSVYGAGGKIRPAKDHRQCPGASAHYRSAEGIGL